jgi:hypothetical protein
MAVDWNKEIAIYNNASQNSAVSYDPQLKCTNYSPNFQGALEALLDTAHAPLCAAGDIAPMHTYLNTPRNGYDNSYKIDNRAWAAVAKAQKLESAYGLTGEPLSGALRDGIDVLTDISNIVGFVTDNCGPYRAQNAANSTCISLVRSRIAGFRTPFVTFFTVLQEVEAATVPTAAAKTTTTSTSTPAGTAQVAAETTESDATGYLGEGAAGVSTTDVLTLLGMLSNVIVPEFTYQGTYRYVVGFQVPANQTNYPLALGFPARIFRLDTQFPIVLRLGSTNGDQIYLDYQTTPYKMKKIPAGLAFNTVYITNTLNQVITVNAFVMG